MGGIFGSIKNRLDCIKESVHPTPCWVQIEYERWNKKRMQDPKCLLSYGYSVYSQNDEDGILQEIFCRIGTEEKIFFEFGVQNGRECNSLNLLMLGWKGVWLEGNEKFCIEIGRSHRKFIDENRLTIKHCFITAENINFLMKESLHKINFKEIDLLSIDIDFNDYWVWQAIDVYHPRVVVIEYNAKFRPPTCVVVPYDPRGTWDNSHFQGASLSALELLGRKKGYALVACNNTGVNAFFVREDLVQDLFLAPYTAEMHYSPPHWGRGQGHPVSSRVDWILNPSP